MKGIWKQAGDETGSEILELALVLLPLLVLVFLIVDICWFFFAQASLQYAVGSGVRYAITNQNLSEASIKSVVQQNAMGFLSGQTGLDEITVNYYSPSNPGGSPLTGAAATAGGNIVEVSVSGVTVNPLGFIWSGGPTSISLGASSTDVIESPPPPGS